MIIITISVSNYKNNSLQFIINLFNNLYDYSHRVKHKGGLDYVEK